MPPPNFFLQSPVARKFFITAHFNDPRAYTFAPTKLQLHEGVDLAAVDNQGNPVAVLAAQRGVVDFIGFSPQGYGNYVRIAHDWQDEKWVTWYGHMSEVTTQVGQFVLPGQKLGIAGTTGFSTGIHLHITLQRIGHGLQNYVVDDVVNPEPFFNLDAQPPFPDAVFVTDVTVADGSVVAPGQPFEKIWRMRNTGTVAWDTGYRLAFSAGDQMGGLDSIPLTGTVQPSQIVDLTAKLVAPAQKGQYRGRWQLFAPDGTTFGPEIDVKVEVKEARIFNEASYVADVTIEDGTLLLPGQHFTKTWRIRNSGTTTWNEQYTLRFTNAERMAGPVQIALPRKVAPGDMIELSVPLVAPIDAGRHRSEWKLHDANGQVFDYEQYAEIQVPDQQHPVDGLNECRWVADVTVPDETQMQPGASFVKTWRIRNSGTTTWGDGYILAFFGDEKMGASNNVPLPPARPGDTVEVSVTLAAPTEPGLHRSTWKPQDPSGKFFEFDQFALIDVIDNTRRLVADKNELAFVADVTVNDGTPVKPGKSFVKTWRVRNNGTTTWGAGYTLAYFADDRMQGPNSVPLPITKPGDTADISVTLTAPTALGPQKSTWKPRDAHGNFFDYHLFALVTVTDPKQTYDLLPYLKGDGRLYSMLCEWVGSSQIVQTQTGGQFFYHVKDSEWEELWADDHFIYRGTDTSPGDGKVYTLTQQGEYGSPWIPRQMALGVPFHRTPLVTFRRKDDGTELNHHTDVTWIKLESVISRYKLKSGITIQNVAVLAAYQDEGGKPKDEPFERYYYAKKYGLVAWEGEPGCSYLTQEFAAGTHADNQREVIGWLSH